MEEKQIKFYETSDGKIPFKQWYKRLDNSLKGKINQRLKRIITGNYGSYRTLSGDVFELKFINGVRIYFAEQDRTIILLLLGGNKTRQSDDIEKAQKYLKDHKERNKNG